MAFVQTILSSLKTSAGETMNAVQHRLCELVKATLNNTSYTVPIDDIHRVYSAARDAELSGMVFGVLDHASIPPDVYARFRKDALLFQAHHEKQIYLIDRIKTVFDKANIPHIFLKGAVLKARYPEPYMRSMGDIDVLVNKTDHHAALTQLKRIGFTITGDSRAHTNLLSPEKMRVELHPELYSSIHPKYDGLFHDVWSHAVLVDKQTHRFTPDFELAYLTYHTIKHFYGTGVGLRTVLDIGLYAKHHENTIDSAAFRSFLKAHHLLTVFMNMLELSERCFSLSAFDNLRKDHTMTDTLYDGIIKHIFASGVHGKSASYNPFIGRVGAARLKKQGRLRFALTLLFPSYADMKATRGWLRSPLLLPFAWAGRLMRLLFGRTKRSFKKIKHLCFKRAKADETSAMFRELGL